MSTNRRIFQSPLSPLFLQFFRFHFVFQNMPGGGGMAKRIRFYLHDFASTYKNVLLLFSEKEVYR